MIVIAEYLLISKTAQQKYIYHKKRITIPFNLHVFTYRKVNKRFIHRKNNFEEYKILLDTDLKIILLDQQNNFGTLKIMRNAAKNLDIPATTLNVLHNYFNSSTTLIF